MSLFAVLVGVFWWWCCWCCGAREGVIYDREREREREYLPRKGEKHMVLLIVTVSHTQYISACGGGGGVVGWCMVLTLFHRALSRYYY